jgi:hypothetical protein
LRSNQFGMLINDVMITAMQAIDSSISILIYIIDILFLKSR